MISKAFAAIKPWILTLTIVLVVGYGKLLLNSLIAVESPILLFFAAIAFAAWMGGFKQGLFAIFFAALFITQHFILDANNSTPIDIWLVRMGFFFVDGLAISLVCSEFRKSRSRLRRSEGYLRRIFEANMMGLSISDASGKVIEANNYYLNMLGADREMLKSGQLNWWDYTDPQYKDRSDQAIQDLQRTGHTMPFEKTYVRKDGTKVSALMGASKTDDNTNIGFFLDLSHSQIAERLSESEKFLESIIEYIPNMIFVKDAKDFRFVRFNRAGEELVGHSRKEMIGKSDYDFFPKEQADFFIAKDRAVFEARKVVDIPEEPILTSTGIRYLHTKKIPVFDADGNPQFLIGISEDITEKKIAEQQKIELLQAQVAREEAEKSAERMTVLTEQANEANRAKSAFLANISHEIRTPLGAMLGFAELAQESSDLNQNSEYMKTVLRNGKELLRIVDEVLDLSKAESNSIEIESLVFNLPDLLTDISDLMAVKAQQKNLKLEFKTLGSIPQTISSDPLRIRQILLNVVGNAIKFTHEGSVCVETSIESSQNEEMLKFIVTDTGIGIDRSQIEKLFKPFTQADDSTTRKFGGTGLGLFLSRRLAGLMGGGVRILDSGPGQGSRFEIKIKIDKTETRPKPSKIKEDSSTLPKNPSFSFSSRVLIVDDSEDNQELIAAYLSSEKIPFTRASRGLDAIAMADNTYSAVLMDIQMPEMDGFEALKRLREKGVNVPVIATTAHAMKGDRERCLEAGFTEYLSKPILRKSLLECLRGIS